MDNKGEIKDNKNFAQKTFENMKEFTKDKAIPSIKKTAENTKNAVTNVSNKAIDKIKTNITEEQMLEILNSLYLKSVNGIPKVSLPVDDLVEDYIKKNPSVEEAAKSLINNSTVKCGTSGFLTGFGGFATMIATLPANITSVMYVQLRMCCAIAKMAGYDIHSDQVQTLIYACLTGSAMSDILKQAGIKFGQKFGVAMVKKIPSKTITAINQKVGFRFVTKFGEKGIVNLGKVVPVLGAFIGGGIDVASTRIIGNNAYKVFIKGELPTKEEIEKEIPIEIEAIEITDIDTETLNDAINNKVKPEDIEE
ncbi:MAG: EcsC family protein [Clostridia bacterium]|nr:EcsC family protein [Clostridia bacterium]